MKKKFCKLVLVVAILAAGAPLLGPRSLSSAEADTVVGEHAHVPVTIRGHV